FPAVASAGQGVMETFVAVVQEMLTAIAVKYSLKEKGLDPAAVPDIVTQAFAEVMSGSARVRPEDLPPPAADGFTLEPIDSLAFTGSEGLPELEEIVEEAPSARLVLS